MLYRYDFRYSIAKFYFNNALRLNFSKIVFSGRSENVSKHRPVIFAPNHRNALIDALLVVMATYHKKQVVFLARADIFKQKLIAWVLRGMRIMPVFRMRDGKDNLDRNNEVFNNAHRADMSRIPASSTWTRSQRPGVPEDSPEPEPAPAH